MIQAEQAENGGVQVVDADLVLDGFVTELVGCSAVDAGLDAAAREPSGEGPRVVVAARFAAGLGDRQSAKFAAAKHES